MCLLPLAVAAQTPAVIPLASEPHHHLVFHNQYVNAYSVEVAPRDSVLLHRHDFDAVSIMMSDAQVTVHTPGKPDTPRNVADGEVRLQPRGYVHSTSIDGETPYRNTTIELLLPQEGARNLCAAVIATQPLNCPDAPASRPNETHTVLPQFATDQTFLTLVRVLPHQSISEGDPDRSELVVALDADVVLSGDATSPTKLLHPGDCVWLDRGQATQVFRNNSDKEARLVSFLLRPIGSATTASPK
jgi:quercetin dioxygenase-like cupin family protein